MLTTITNYKVWMECGETSQSARRSQQWPPLFSVSLQRDWDILRRLHNNLHTMGSLTQSGNNQQLLVNITNHSYITPIPKPVMEILLWPLILCCNEVCVCTYCLILSFWGPNLGPVGPLLKNKHGWSQMYRLQAWIVLFYICMFS